MRADYASGIIGAACRAYGPAPPSAARSQPPFAKSSDCMMKFSSQRLRLRSRSTGRLRAALGERGIASLPGQAR